MNLVTGRREIKKISYKGTKMIDLKNENETVEIGCPQISLKNKDRTCHFANEFAWHHNGLKEK
jgi:hypothetical protein